MNSRTNHSRINSLAAALLIAIPAQAQTLFDADFEMPLSAAFTVDSTECDHSNGPVVTISGNVLLPKGFGMRYTLANNLKGTHTDVVETVVDLALIQPDSKII